MAHPKPFHHGNLKAALLDAARTELEASGYESLSLRQLAKTLGVSRSAPYRHFENREALLKDLTAQWSDDMNKVYRSIQAMDLPAEDRLAKACMAYQDSAMQAPELYRLMFATQPLWDIRNADDVQTSTDLQRFRMLVADASSNTSDSAINEAVMLIGCALHGYAMLRITGQIDKALIAPLITRVVMRIVNP